MSSCFFLFLWLQFCHLGFIGSFWYRTCFKSSFPNIELIKFEKLFLFFSNVKRDNFSSLGRRFKELPWITISSFWNRLWLNSFVQFDFIFIFWSLFSFQNIFFKLNFERLCVLERRIKILFYLFFIHFNVFFYQVLYLRKSIVFSFLYDFTI